MTRTTLLALAERVEAATSTEQREMLEAAFVAIHGPKPERVHGGSPEWLAWLDLHNPFFALLQAGGFLDAAMSLVPSGDAWTVGQNVHHRHWVASINYLDNGEPKSRDGSNCASTPALALTAACLRARAIAGSLPD